MHKTEPAKLPPRSTGAAKCPVDHDAQQAMLKARSQSGAKCPVKHDTSDGLNPLNSIPVDLATAKQPGQVMDLSTERTPSSIPRARDAEGQDEGEVWDYPSPQQFYNALVRKGWETPEESMEVVTEIHNFLNEAAWEEVMQWERRFPGSVSPSFLIHTAYVQRRVVPIEKSSRQTARALSQGEMVPFLGTDLAFTVQVSLPPSTGRPDLMFSGEKPFDKHEWILSRPATGVTARYIIDYYSAGTDAEGSPVFSLDVRPALDSLEAINQRVQVAFEEWMKGGQ